MEKYLYLFEKNPLFAGIPSSDIIPLLKSLGVYIKSYSRESFVRHAGDKVDFIGIILRGQLQILKYDFDGNRHITSVIETGQMFAEAFACADVPALPVDILAISDCEILFINKDPLLQSSLLLNLLKIVAKKNMILNQKLQIISSKTTASKIMAYLNDQAKQQKSREFDIPFDRQAMADYLGVERSAMSAELSKLKRDGIIETRKNHFKLLV